MGRKTGSAIFTLRLPPRIGRVLDLKLDAITPAPGVAAQMSRDVQRHARGRHQQVAQWLAGGAKRYGIEPSAVAAFEQDADVGVADNFAEFHAVRRQHEAGFGVALAEGADAFDQIHQLACRTGGDEGRVDVEPCRIGNAAPSSGEDFQADNVPVLQGPAD